MFCRKIVKYNQIQGYCLYQIYLRDENYFNQSTSSAELHFGHGKRRKHVPETTHV